MDGGPLRPPYPAGKEVGGESGRGSGVPLPLKVSALQDKAGVYFVKGAFEQVVRFCSSYNSRGAALPLSSQQRELYQQQISYMGSSGLRGNSASSWRAAALLLLTVPSLPPSPQCWPSPPALRWGT